MASYFGIPSYGNFFVKTKWQEKCHLKRMPSFKTVSEQCKCPVVYSSHNTKLLKRHVGYDFERQADSIGFVCNFYFVLILPLPYHTPRRAPAMKYWGSRHKKFDNPFGHNNITWIIATWRQTTFFKSGHHNFWTAPSTFWLSQNLKYSR